MRRARVSSRGGIKAKDEKRSVDAVSITTNYCAREVERDSYLLFFGERVGLFTSDGLESFNARE